MADNNAAPLAGAKVIEQYAAATVDILAIPAGKTGTGSVKVDADADFFVTEVVGIVTKQDDVTAVALPPVVIQGKDGANRDLAAGGPMHFGNFAGTAAQPHKLPRPVIVRGGTTLSFAATNLDLANAVTVRLVLHGFKRYTLGG